MSHDDSETTPDVASAGDALDGISRRLDALLSLLVEWDPTTGESRSAKEQSIRLFRSGLRPIEIANITGRHASNISRDLSQARKDGTLPKSVSE